MRISTIIVIDCHYFVFHQAIMLSDLLVGVKDCQEWVLRCKQSALFLQREAWQETTGLVVPLRCLLTQPGDGAGVGQAAGEENHRSLRHVKPLPYMHYRLDACKAT